MTDQNITVNVKIEKNNRYHAKAPLQNNHSRYQQKTKKRSTFTRFVVSLWNTAIVLLCCWMILHLYMNHIYISDTGKEAFEAKYLEPIQSRIVFIRNMIKTIDIESLKVFATAIVFIIALVISIVLMFVLAVYPLLAAAIVYNMLILCKGTTRI